MSIDAAEIARLRARAEKADGAFISISGWDVLAILAELGAARERIEGMRQANVGMAAERDAAHALLRECDSELPGLRPAPPGLRARISKLIGDA